MSTIMRAMEPAGATTSKTEHKRWAWLPDWEGIHDPAHRTTVRIGLALAAVAVLLRFFFWWYTGRLWEDALITTLHAENVRAGFGLSHFRVGQPPIHGFTSPLSVLVPLLGDIVQPGWGLHVIRFVSAWGGGLTVLYALAIAVHPKVRLPRPFAVLAMGYLAVEHTQLLWGMAGMETQIITCILLASIYYGIAWRPAALGLSLGLCMLARPDFAFWTVVMGLYVLCKDWRALPRVVGWAVAVYAPWVVFTTLYYGSTVPNTIYAKSYSQTLWWQRGELGLVEGLLRELHNMSGLFAQQTIAQPLGPTFPGHGTGFFPTFPYADIIGLFMAVMAYIGVGAILVRRHFALYPLACFVIVYAAYYVVLVPLVYGWYLPPFCAVLILAAAYGLKVGTRPLPAWLPRLIAGAYLLVVAGNLFWTIPSERMIQKRIEEQVRLPIGKYLDEIMGPRDTIGCECLGYIGYHSRRSVTDWPGLANREVVEFLRENPDKRSMNAMLNHFRPDFLVLREHNGNLWELDDDWVYEAYKPVRHFTIDRTTIADVLYYHKNIDTSFLVLERKDHVRTQPGVRPSPDDRFPNEKSE